MNRTETDLDHGSGRAHFAKMSKLAAHLADSGTAIHFHQYDPHFNSAWQIVVGTQSHALKFFWDARDQFFAIQQCSLKKTQFGIEIPPDYEWADLGDLAVDARNGQDAFEFLERYVRSFYPAKD